jgi:peptidyl-prolyl cis-trans isomerase A (cyclophilin A)
MVRMQKNSHRQPKWQQRITLCVFGFGLGVLILMLSALYQIDAFPKRRKRLAKPTLQALTPDKLIQNPDSAVQYQQNQDEKQNSQSTDGNSNNLRGQQQEQQQVPQVNLQEIQQDQQDQDASLETILSPDRFIMHLANLIPDASKDNSTVGQVVIELRPDWAPIGAAHFVKLVEDQFFDQTRFFRCLTKFVVQFGIAADPAQQVKWKSDVLVDDPVKHTNARGTLTYAMSGPNTRTTQLFINTRLVGNAYLDKEGFTPFAEIVEGMDVIDRINHEYKEQPNQNKIVKRGNEYLMEEFPRLSYIESLRRLNKSEER